MALIRLQKLLSMAGCCSRRHGEKYITDGLVKVNGKVVTELGAKVDPEKDRVEIKGKPVIIKRELVYIALNKPTGYVSSCSQPRDKIVLDLINISKRVYPVGRLDKDSTGLLLLTNDGGLHHRLSHPSFDHEKEYEVTVANPMTDRALLNMEQGMPIMGTKTRPAETKRISPKRFRIVLKEGKNRQIRRMVGKTGNRVTRLNRIRIANIKLGRLVIGKWRHLTKKEKDTLFTQHIKSL
ncbi:MAG: pseudouridine synthase [Thermodesulfobacteriota bacterium]|nr:pseudouridine synthase [Thermodesulfobacteriota bacterium]